MQVSWWGSILAWWTLLRPFLWAAYCSTSLVGAFGVCGLRWGGKPLFFAKQNWCYTLTSVLVTSLLTRLPLHRPCILSHRCCCKGNSFLCVLFCYQLLLFRQKKKSSNVLDLLAEKNHRKRSSASCRNTQLQSGEALTIVIRVSHKKCQAAGTLGLYGYHHQPVCCFQSIQGHCTCLRSASVVAAWIEGTGTGKVSVSM